MAIKQYSLKKDGKTYLAPCFQVKEFACRASDTILIDDGLIELKVNEVNDTEIVCTVVNGGELGERKGVNVPNVSIKLPALTEKDKEDIRFGI